MDQVLFIAYYFPPMGGAGVQRTLKFVKYLPEYNWQPHVLTVSSQNRLQDASLKNDIPPGLSLTCTPTLSLPGQLPWRLRRFITRWILVVDEQIGWLPFAVKAGRQIIRHDKIDAIFSTSSPYTTHLIAHRLHRQTHIPWVADFRDPWIGNYTIKYPTVLHRWINEILERRVVSDAERVILNTNRAELFYRQKYPQYPPGKFQTIPNGYDHEDLHDMHPFSQERVLFSITHLGSLYQKTRSSIFFLKALQQAIQRGELPANKVRVRFIGNVDKETQGYVRQFILKNNVEIFEYTSHREAISQLYNSDLLLLIASYGNGSELFIPAKLYEYLACQKPILCLADPGACAELVVNARAGSVIPPKEVDTITKELVRLYRQWERGQLTINPDMELVQSFERRKITAQLANVLTGVLK